MDRDRVYSRDEVEALISEGRKLFIVNGALIKADAWLKYHPGGDIAILHMVGRDASDEVVAYVYLSKALRSHTHNGLVYTQRMQENA